MAVAALPVQSWKPPLVFTKLMRGSGVCRCIFFLQQSGRGLPMPLTAAPWLVFGIGVVV